MNRDIRLLNQPRGMGNSAMQKELMMFVDNLVEIRHELNEAEYLHT